MKVLKDCNVTVLLSNSNYKFIKLSLPFNDMMKKFGLTYGVTWKWHWLNELPQILTSKCKYNDK